MNDSKRIEKLKTGELKTWRKLRQEIQKKIKTLVFKNTKIPDLEEFIKDVGKEVELKIWQKLQKENDPKPIQSLENYIFILVRNEIFKQNKQQIDFTEITQNIENSKFFNPSEEEAYRQDMQIKIRGLWQKFQNNEKDCHDIFLKRLPKLKEILKEDFFDTLLEEELEEVPYGEIVKQEKNLKAGTLRTQMNRCREKLKKITKDIL